MKRAKYRITTNSPKDSEWKRLVINGDDTNYVINAEGTIVNTYTHHVVQDVYTDTSSRAHVYLNVNGKQRCLLKKRVFASIFVPIPDKYKDIDQLELDVYQENGDHSDLSLDNLKWHYPRDPDAQPSDLPYYKKITTSQVNEVYDLLMTGKYSPQKISTLTGIGIRQVNAVKTSKNCFSDLRTTENIPRSPFGRYPEKVIRKVCELAETGLYSMREISTEMEIPYRITQHILCDDNVHVNIKKDYDLSRIKHDVLPKLSEDEVREICTRFQNGDLVSDIAEDFNISSTSAYDLYNRKYYTDISKDYTWGCCLKRPRLSEEKIRAVCEMLQDGVTIAQTHKELGVSASSVSLIYNRKRHRNISKDYKW